MCYRNCPHELREGECGKRPQDICPEVYETDDEYECACQEVENHISINS